MLNKTGNDSPCGREFVLTTTVVAVPSFDVLSDRIHHLEALSKFSVRVIDQCYRPLIIGFSSAHEAYVSLEPYVRLYQAYLTCT